MTTESQDRTRALTDREKWEAELDKHSERLCPGSGRIGIRHLWWPTKAPIICTWLGGKSVIVGVGVACQWSGWNEKKKRQMDCYSGPWKIKTIVDFKVQGLTPKIWHEEMAKGPSFHNRWGWNLIETEHGWRNVNEHKLNDGPMIYEVWSPKAKYAPIKPLEWPRYEKPYPDTLGPQNIAPWSIVGQDKASAQPEAPEFPLEEPPEWADESFV